MMKGWTHVSWSWKWIKRSGVTLKGPANHKVEWDIKSVERVTCIRKMKVAYSILKGIPQGRRCRCRLKKKIKIYLKETGCEDIG